MAIGKRKRFEILNRDGFKCQYCGRPSPVVVLHVDHRRSKYHGGTDDDANLVTACADCNFGKFTTSVLAIRHDLDFEARTMFAVEDAHDRTFNRHLLYRGSAGLEEELLSDVARPEEYSEVFAKQWTEEELFRANWS
jgi:hypothetical protein